MHLFSEHSCIHLSTSSLTEWRITRAKLTPSRGAFCTRANRLKKCHSLNKQMNTRYCLEIHNLRSLVLNQNFIFFPDFTDCEDSVSVMFLKTKMKQQVDSKSGFDLRKCWGVVFSDHRRRPPDSGLLQTGRIHIISQQMIQSTGVIPFHMQKSRM